MKTEFSLLDSMPVGAFVVSRDMTVRYWNPCMEDWTGIKRADIVATSLAEAFPVFLEKRYEARLYSVFEQGTPVLLTYRLHGNLFANRDPSCMERVYHTTVTRLAGDEPCALFTLEDRTEVSNRIMEARQELDRRIETERLLRSALEEKEVLFREIHHRVKNNLNSIISLIHLQLDAIDDEPTQAHLGDLEARIQSFSLLHETLYRGNVYDKIDIAEYLGIVVERLQESTSAAGVHCAINLKSVVISVKKALYLGLALVELLTNAMKYGRSADGSTTIAIDLVPAEAGSWILRVRDNGPGISENAITECKDSLGLKLIQMMADELSGSIRFLKPADGGTQIDFSFSSDIEQTE
ncbi:MAG: hypothetical protein A2Y38_18675 [Spirochaetes bacterium GWB1_59_5]|nr:MAG: hypothetical protein A2Y38_18675 [Spirochaetes bacterium GWB1_59_5]